MASTTLEKKKARDYYRKNKSYREAKKEDRLEYAKSHKKKEAKQSKNYYWENSEYRKTKQKQAREYKRKHSAKK